MIRGKSKLTTLIFIVIFTMISCFVNGQQQISNLPTMRISTQDNQPVNSKTVWIPAQVTVLSSEPTEQLDMVAQIRGRGNSTWNMPKKPYRIKLDKKTNLFNLPAKEKDWVLLANYADKTLIRNALAFRIGEIAGLPFNPSARFVDLVLNNVYQGNYMLTDQVEVGSARVNVRKQASTDIDEPAITGGYLLEIDGFAATEPVWFTSSGGLKITIKSPDDLDINSQQIDYIRNYINRFESLLFASSFNDPLLGYRPMVDTTTLVNWYIASELTGNSDAFWSTYVYKNVVDDKLCFGPLWDYDIAFNNDRRLNDAVEKRMSDAAHNPRTWIQRFLQDEWFVSAVWRRWKQLHADNLHGKLISYINQLTEEIDASQKLNFQKWNVLNTRVYQETFLFSTYAGGVDYLKTYIGNRINFLNTSFYYKEPEKPSEPFVPENFYYMIMNKRTNNVIDVSNSSVMGNATLVMWEPIEEKTSQLWEISRVDNEWFRITNKNSGLAMSGNGRGTNLIQVPVNAADNKQLWKFVPVLTGNIYGIVNKFSGYSINNSGGSFANGTNTIEWDSNVGGSENQQWYLHKMEALAVSGIAKPALQHNDVHISYNKPEQLIQIKLNFQNSEDLNVSCYNLAGMLIYSENHNLNHAGENHLSIPAKSFTPGIYLMRIGLKGFEPVTRKIVIGL